MASPRSRQAARLRERRRRAQRRARRLVALSLIGVLGLITLLLTAFGSGSARTAVPVPIVVQTTPANAEAVRPRPQMLATIGNLQIQLPVAAARAHRDRLPRHERRLALAPAGRPAGERRHPRPSSGAASPARDATRRAGTSSRAARPARTSSTSALPPGRTSTRRWTARSSRSAEARRGRQTGREPYRRAAVQVAVGHGLRDERAARPGDRGRHAGARRLVEARDRRRHRVTSRSRRSRRTHRRRQQRLDLGLPLSRARSPSPWASLRVLFVGDVVGQPGRDAVEALLPGLRERLEVDVWSSTGRTSRTAWDHAKARRPASRRRRRRDHARQPRLATRGDRAVPRDLAGRHPPGELPGSAPRGGG